MYAVGPLHRPSCDRITLPPTALLTLSSLTYDPDTRTLNCTSTGSPATNVTWTKDGGTLTANGTAYSMTQTLTDRSASTYENVLTLPTTGDISGMYGCQVGNALGDSTTVTFEVTGKSYQEILSDLQYCTTILQDY